MDLSSLNHVRKFLALCLDPVHGIKRTPAKLAAVMPDEMIAAVDRYAPHLAELRQAADEAERQARAARKKYADGLAAWITSGKTPLVAPVVADPGECAQNRTGNFIRLTDPVTLGPHFYKDNGVTGLRCLYCDVPAHWGGEPLVAPTVRPYVYNSRSVNRTAKHAVHPDDPRVTLCLSSYAASDPMPEQEAARLPLCGACRRAVTGQQD